MQARQEQSQVTSESKVQLDSCQTIKFIQQVDAITKELSGYLEKKSFAIHDGLEDVREQFESLKRTLTQVGPQLRSFEENRKPLSIDLDYYDERNAAQQVLDKVKSALKKVQPNFERKKQQVTNQIENIETQIDDDRWKNLLKKAKYIEEQNTKLNELDGARKSMEKQRDKLKEKIQGKCCYAMKSVAKKEKEELARVEGVLKDLHMEIESTYKKRQDAQAKQDTLAAKKDNLISKRDKLKLNKEALINSFPERLDAAEQAVTDARKILARLDAKRKTLQKQHLRNVSRDVMFDLVHIYAKFCRIKEALYNAYIFEQKNGSRVLESESKYRQKMEGIDIANGLFVQKEGLLFSALKHISCDEADGCRGSEAFDNFKKLDKAMQDNFVQSDFSPNEIMDAILPITKLQQASRTIVDDIAAARMSSMHLFFSTGGAAQPLSPEGGVMLKAPVSNLG